jgi:WD40 repeat protein
MSGAAQVFDMSTGDRVAKLPGPVDYGTLAADAGDHGRYVAAGGMSDPVVDVWDFAGRRPVRRELRVSGGYIGSVALDPSSGLIAAASDSKLYVWSLPDAKLVRTLELGSSVRDVRFSPGGGYLAVIDYGSSARLWDVRTWRKYTLRGHTAPINSLAFAPRRPLVATASDDGSVRVWTPQGDLQAVVRPRSHRQALDAEFSPDGGRIAVAGAGGAAEIYTCALCGGTRELYEYAKDHVPLSR